MSPQCPLPHGKNGTKCSTHLVTEKYGDFIMAQKSNFFLVPISFFGLFPLTSGSSKIMKMSDFFDLWEKILEHTPKTPRTSQRLSIHQTGHNHALTTPSHFQRPSTAPCWYGTTLNTKNPNIKFEQIASRYKHIIIFVKSKVIFIFQIMLPIYP